MTIYEVKEKDKHTHYSYTLTRHKTLAGAMAHAEKVMGFYPEEKYRKINEGLWESAIRTLVVVAYEVFE